MVCRSAYTELCHLYLLKPAFVERYPVLSSVIHKSRPGDALGLTELQVAALQINYPHTFKDRIASTSRDLIDQVDCRGRTALAWAAELGNLDQIDCLLRKGANPNTADSRGATPLLHSDNDVQCLTTLLEAGAYVNHSDHAGYTKLEKLVISGDSVDCLEVLWKFGVDLNFRSKHSVEAIFPAVERHRPQTIRWLLEHGANLEVRDALGDTPLLRFLSCTSDEWPDILGILLAQEPNYSVLDNWKEGVLHYAARFSSFRYMQVFGQRADLSGLDPDQRSACGFKLWESNRPGKTPIELAIWRRDHQLEWSQECFTPLDPDPQAWFAAFEVWIRSIGTAREMKKGLAQNSNIKECAAAVNDEIDTGVRTSTNNQNCFLLPGAFPEA